MKLQNTEHMHKIAITKSKGIFLNHWPIIIITAISFLLPAIWFRDGMGIGYVETGLMYLIEPSKLLSSYIHTWFDVSLGYINTSIQPSLFFLLTSLLRLVGFSLVSIQYLTFSFILLISSIAMYFLTKELFSDFDNVNFIALFSAFFYILNPYTMNVWHRFVSSIFGLPLMPLVFLITIRILKKPSFKYSFLFAIIILLFSLDAVNPAFFIPVFIPSIIYALFETLRNKKQILIRIKYIGLGIILAILLNLWWIINSILTLKQIYNLSGVPTLLTNIGALRVMSEHYPISHISRLLDTITIPWYGINYQPGWIEILIPLLVITGICFYIKNKKVIILTVIIIIGLFLGKGLQPPGGKIFEWMFLNIPGFAMFRKSFEKFGLILPFCYSFLISIGLFKIIKLVKFKALKILTTIPVIILLLVLSVWPMWTGDVFSFSEVDIPSECEFIPTTKVKMPEYWYEAASIVNLDKEDYRLVFLPQAQFDAITYKWEYGYYGNDTTSINYLFENPVISKPVIITNSENYRKTVLDNNFFKKVEITPQLFSFLNIRYILVRNDISPISLGNAELMVPFETIKNLLESSENIEKIKTFDKIDIYKLDDNYFLPHIYIPKEIIYTDKTIEEPPSVIGKSNYPLRSAIYLNNQINNSGKDLPESSENLEVPRITFIKINPTKYKIKVENAKEPYILVFLESFHKNWKLYINKTNIDNPDSNKIYKEEVASYFNGEIKEGSHRNTFLELATFETWGKKPIAEDRHFIANGYANSWYIKPSDVDNQEEYEITIEFWPQKFIYIGLAIAILTLFSSIIFLLIRLFRRKNKAESVPEK